MSHEHIGYARFGKLDGFQWLERSGIMDHFRSPEDISMLSQLLALRQEAIRIYAGEKILGLTHLSKDGHQYRFITSYSYKLDRYKRDGYMAVSLALREVKVKPADVLECLEQLEEAELGEVPDQVLSAFRQKLMGWPVAFACPSRPSQATAFVVLSSWESCEQLLMAACEGMFQQYQWIYASAGSRTGQGLDTREVDVLRLSSPNKKVETEKLSVPDKAPAESLIYAFETRDSQWDKPKSKSTNKSKSGFGIHSLKKWLKG